MLCDTGIARTDVVNVCIVWNVGVIVDAVAIQILLCLPEISENCVSVRPATD